MNIPLYWKMNLKGFKISECRNRWHAIGDWEFCINLSSSCSQVLCVCIKGIYFWFIFQLKRDRSCSMEKLFWSRKWMEGKRHASSVKSIPLVNPWKCFVWINLKVFWVIHFHKLYLSWCFALVLWASLKVTTSVGIRECLSFALNASPRNEEVLQRKKSNYSYISQVPGKILKVLGIGQGIWDLRKLAMKSGNEAED